MLGIADFLEPHLRAIGKPGHKHKSFPNQLIVAASEFVRCKTGSYNDEHLAELFQPIANDVSDDLSGDAIRKRRDQMETTYPDLYAAALRLAQATAGASETAPREH
jgi:hypothetical protein